MSRNHLRLGGALATAAVVLAAAVAQEPAKPPLPPINPATARLDQTINGLDGPGFAIAADQRTGALAAGCDRGTIRYWNKDVALGVRNGDRSPNVLHGHQGAVLALAWNGGAGPASAGADRQVFLWDLAEGKPKHTLRAATLVRCLALSPDGKRLAGGGEDGAVHLWEVDTGRPLMTDEQPVQLKGHTDWVLALTFRPDGKLLASSGHDGTVVLWDVAGRKKQLDFAARPPAPPNTPTEPAPTVASVAFSPDGKLLAVGNAAAQIHLFGVADGKFVRTLAGHTSTVTGLAFHSGGAVLVSASKDRTLRLWNPANGQMLKALEGHTAWVQGVTFLAQGTRLASVGADQTVRLWDLTSK
jgi:WD40 repeat protein